MSNSLAIDVQNLSKVYHIYPAPIDRLKEVIHPFRKKYHHDFNALSDVSFQVGRGETVGIIGRNGAGKSTLLKILTGVLTPSSGHYSVHGRISSLLELGTGFNPELPGIDNIYFNAMLLDVPREEVNRKLDAIIKFADIGEFLDIPVKTYSSGMFARLAFAVAFHVDPDILIIDEALSVGDSAFQKKCFERFADIRSRGCTILFVSHDTYQIKGFCQRAIYLKRGECVMFGNSADVVDAYAYDLEREIAKDAEAQKLVEEEPEEIPQNSNSLAIRITGVELLNGQDLEIDEARTGQTVKIRFRYKISGFFDGKLSFVVNLYRHDDFYICGATSRMDRLPAFEAQEEGQVTVIFKNLQLLSGRYKWRVAINDETGLGIYTEAVPVCEFSVKDGFESVGLVHFEREWVVE